MKLIVSALCLIFGFNTAATDSPKCSIYDSECQRNFFQSVGVTYAKTGIPAIGVKVIDPFQLNNITTSILGLWNLTLVDGEAEGIAKCILTSYNTDVKKRRKVPEMICDTIVIRGNYKLIPSPVVQESSVNFNADGRITITIENWYFKVDYPFKIVRHADGLIYVEAIFDKATYKSVMGKVTIQADGIRIGNVDISETASCWMNDNWKLFMYSDIGKFVNDKSAQFYYETYNKFFTRMPASLYYSDKIFETMLDETVPNKED